MKISFTRRQLRIISACLVLYSSAYICRLNLAAALGQITEALNITAAQGGLLQTMFALTYAAGQLVNGAMVDRVNPVRHMLLGLAGSAVCNLVFGFCSDFEVMIALHLLNGAFQSMMWTPIVRLIADHFHDQAGREKANLIVSMTMILGHFFAWAIAGYLSTALNWRFSFIVPAFICIPALLLSAWLLRGLGHTQRTAAQPGTDAQTARTFKLLPLFAGSGFLVMLLCSVLFGFVRDGITTWTPTLLIDLSGGNDVVAVSVSLIIPVINGAGTFLVYAMMRAMRLRSRNLMGLVMAIGGCFILPLTGGQGMLLTSLLLGCCCACVFGLEPVITALIPLEYDRENIVGLTAGIVDSLIYVGSALAGVCGGWIYDLSGSGGLYVTWFVSALAGAACALISGQMLSHYRAKQNI